jgi:DNA-binding IclR family transcriptional regulator
MPAKKPKGEYAIQTVTNALRVLDAFRNADDYGVTELASRLHLHKNNVFRLLATLEQQGYIEQLKPTDRYRLGIRSFELGQAFTRGRSLHTRAHRYLEEVAEETGESAHLAIMREYEVVYIDGVTSDQLISTGSLLGRRLPLHCTAAGKILLGCAPDALREEYDRTVVAKIGLTDRTPSTMTDPHKLFEHIRSARVAGFALEIEECVAGLCCAAAPVYDSDGTAIAAISVAGPVFRIGENDLLGRVARSVVGAAERLSQDLGYAASQ